MKKILQHLLMTDDPEKSGGDKYSQSRVYLMISLLVLLGMVISSYFLSFDNKNFQYALDTIFWTNVLFASYALIGKGLSYDHMKKIVSKKEVVTNPTDTSEKIKDNFDNQELS